MAFRTLKAAFVKNRQIVLIYLIIFGLFIFLHSQLDIGEYSTDDFQFEKWGVTQNYFQWEQNFYNIWSGRISTDTTSFIVLGSGITSWRIINPIMLIILIYSISRIIFGAVSHKGFAFASAASFFLLGIVIPFMLSIDSLFGTIASIYYLWPISIGLYSLIPIFDRLLRGKDTKPNLLHLLAGFYVGFAQEQISLFIFVFSLLTLVFLFKKEKRLHRNFIIYMAAMLIGLIFLFSAPGDKARFVEAVKECFPGFDHFSKFALLINGVEYFLKSILMTCKVIVLVFFVTLLIATLSHISKSKNRLLFFAATLLTFSVILLLLVDFEDLGRSTAINKYFFAFDKLLSYDQNSGIATLVFSKTAVFSAFFWLFILCIIVPYLIFQVYKANTNHALANILMYYGALASLIVMFFSPTIYCSGERPRFLLTILLIVLEINVLTSIIPESFIMDQRIVMIIMIAAMVAFSAYYPVFKIYNISTPVNFTEFSVVENTKCGIDSVVKKQNEIFVTINGWFNKYDLGSGNKIFVILKSDQYTDAFSTFPGDNSSPDKLNVTAPLDTARLKSGKYQVGLGIKLPNQKSVDVCYPGTQLVIK